MTIWLSKPKFESIEPQFPLLGCTWMLSMVPGYSVMEMTRKVAYKHNVGSKTAKFVCLKIKNNTVQ